MRHRYNCQINDPVYPPPGGWLGRRLLDFYHRLRGVPTDGLRSSERAIEIPLALDFLAHEVGDESVLELGCVLPYYILKAPNHRVLDLQDRHPENERQDIRSLTDAELSTNVVSISTLEHIGLAEYGIATSPTAGDTPESVRILTRILSLARRAFITFPLGHNPGLDAFVLQASDLGAQYVTRCPDNPEQWQVVARESLTEEMKRENTYCRANAICVIEKEVSRFQCAGQRCGCLI